MRYIEYKKNFISKLSLGTVQFGLDYGISNKIGKPTQKQVNEIIEYIIENGINCFDTAQAYGDSEEILGKTIKNNNIFFISKLSSDIFRENAIQSLEISLKNLKIEKLFSILLHDSKLLYKWNKDDERKVLTLKESNKIDFFGVSIYTQEEFELAINNNSIDIIQVPFNIFDQRAISHKWFEKAKEANKFIFIRSVYLQGLLLMNKESIFNKLPDAVNYINELDILCNKFDLTRNEIALSFVENIAEESSILFGCDSLEQAKENVNNFNNIKFLEKSLIEELIRKFSKVPENVYNPTKW